MTALSPLLLLLVLFASLCQCAILQCKPLGGNWSDPNTWIGGAVPGPTDSVIIATDDTVLASGPLWLNINASTVVQDVTIQPQAAKGGLFMYLHVTTGVKFSATGSISVVNGGLALSGGTVGAVSMDVGVNGLVRGLGTLSVGAMTISGRVSPGSVAVSCTQCTTALDVSPGPILAGILTFEGPTTFSGASVFVKAITQTQATMLIFNNGVTFASPVTTFYADVPATVTGVVTFVSASSSKGTAYTVVARTQPYPWQMFCLSLNCALQQQGPGTLITFGPGGTSVILNPGTVGSATEVCLQSGTISVVVGQCSPTANGPCVPACQHGSCNAVSFCDCQYDAARNFGWTGGACDAPVCANNCGGAVAGTCTAGTPLPTCVCNTFFGGVFCESVICNPVCGAHGTCVMGGNGPICNCATGWTGADCTTQLTAGQCPNCGSFGTCNGNGVCVCQSGWSGSSCNIPVCPGFVAGVSPNCNGNGQCSSTATPTCTCAAGWSGPDCGTRVCLPDSCANGGTCQVSGGITTTCTCAPGWGGSTCNLRTTPDSSSGLQPWLIAVIVIGAVIGGAIIAVSIALVRRYQVRKHGEELKQHLLHKDGSGAAYVAMQ